MIKKYKPRFPILIKKKTLFIWYGDRWMNVKLEIMIHGEGFKGFKNFVKQLYRCAFQKKHTFIKVFYIDRLEDSVECMYCHKKK